MLYQSVTAPVISVCPPVNIAEGIKIDCVRRLNPFEMLFRFFPALTLKQCKCFSSRKVNVLCHNFPGNLVLSLSQLSCIASNARRAFPPLPSIVRKSPIPPGVCETGILRHMLCF